MANCVRILKIILWKVFMVTRNNGYFFKVPKVKLEFAKYGFYFQGVKCFNSWPIRTRKIENFKEFMKEWNHTVFSIILPLSSLDNICFISNRKICYICYYLVPLCLHCLLSFDIYYQITIIRFVLFINKLFY